MKGFPFQITYKGKAALPFSDQSQKTCYFYEIETKKIVPLPIHHHILIVDIKSNQLTDKVQLKNCLKRTLDLLCKQGKHYVSIIAYKKAEGLVQLLSSVKCDRTSYKMAEVDRLIEEAIECGHQGPLSKSLELALEVSRRLKEHCEGHHITLFTDGFFTAPTWDLEEMQECLRVSQTCYQEEVSLNIMALGNYYDSCFLKQLIQVSDSSEWLHVDQLADYERTMSELIIRVDARSKNKINLQNEVAFLCETHHYYTESGTIEGLSTKEKNLLVTYDAPLQLMDTKVKIKIQEALEEVIPYYLYQWTAYLIKEGQIEAAECVIAETKDIAAYKKVCNVYTAREKGQLFKTLVQLAREPKKRYKEGQQMIDRELLKREEPLCLLEILAIILKDNESKLFWDYSYPYERIGPRYQSEEMEYAFIKPTLGYGEIEKICIGSKKLNVGVRVKVKGQVEELKTHLKLDANVYREYNLIVNGNLNTPYLLAQLAPKLRVRLRKQGIIKERIKQGNQLYYKLNLEKMKIVNERTIGEISAEAMANQLYELEVLKLKESMIKKYLKTHLKGFKLPSNKQFKLCQRFHINEQGIFEINTQTLDESRSTVTYRAEIVEWKIEKFPKKKVEGEIVATYQLDSLKPSSKQMKQLEESLSEIKYQKQKLGDAIQLMRIGSVLMRKPIFKWDHTVTKPKKQTIPLIKGNAVVGESVCISTMQIRELAIKEEKYTLLVAHS